MKKFIKFLSFVIGGIMLLPLLLVALLYVPPIQNWAVRWAAREASSLTGLNITLDKVRLTPLLDLSLHDLTATQEGDTILHSRRIVVDLDLTHILSERARIEEVSIEEGSVNTLGLIDELCVKGRLGKLSLTSDDVDFGRSRADITSVSLEACKLAVCMRDTTVTDTTESSPLNWVIGVRRADVRNTEITYRSVRDSIVLHTIISDARLRQANIDLGKSAYGMKGFALGIDTLTMKMMQPDGETLGVVLPRTRLSLHDARLDSVRVGIRQFALDTYSGKGSGSVASSHVGGSVTMDFDAFTTGTAASMTIDAKAHLSKGDIALVAADFLPRGLAEAYPEKPLDLRLICSGNIDRLQLDTLRAEIPGALSISSYGHLADISKTDSIKAAVHLDIKTGDLAWLLRYAGLKGLRLPHSILCADADIEGQKYDLDARLRQGRGTVRAQASLDMATMSYRAALSSSMFDIKEVVPAVDISGLSMTVRARGRGTDISSPTTKADVRARVDRLSYNGQEIADFRLDTRLDKGRGFIDINSINDVLNAHACVTAHVGKSVSDINFDLDMSRIDLHALGLVSKPLSASMVFNLSGHTDLAKTHHFDASINAIELYARDTVFRPLDLNFGVRLSPDTIRAYANDGDLKFHFATHHGLDSLAHKFELIGSEITRQVEQHDFGFVYLRPLLPEIDMSLHCGATNPIGNMLRSLTGFRYDDLSLEAHCDSTTGVTAEGLVRTLNTGAVVLDTIQLDISTKSDRLGLVARVKNGPKNRIVNFESILRAKFNPRGFDLGVQFFDGTQQKGVDLGVDVQSSDSTFTLHVTPLNPIVAFRRFTVNADNHITIDRNYHVTADLDLVADDGTGLKIYSPKESHAQQDLTFSINNLNLDELSSVMPFMPHLTGMLHGDVHIVKDDNMTTISSDLVADDLTYEGVRLGRLGTVLAYFPNSDGSHLVDMILRQDDREIALLQGKYWTQDKQGQIEATAQLLQAPLNLVSGFIPDNMARLEGFVNGEIDVHGPVDKPLVTGTISTQGTHIISDIYNIDLRIPDDKISIRNSLLDFDRIQAYANGDNPFTLDGTIDFARLDDVRLDIKMQTKDFNLINAPRRKGSEAFGKVYVDIDGRVRGSLNNLLIDGRLNVSGKTNMTYILKDSPLTLDDQLSTMVTFCDFSDTVQVEKSVYPEQKVRMNVSIGIDEATTFNIFLSEDGSDNVRIEGGGNLTMTYDMLQGLRLFGRYTILSGKMDYSMIVMSLKDFTIDQGSYVEFTGDVLNPRLDISAHEQKKASVTHNKVSRKVTFDVGLKISQRLEDLGLEFTLEAPNDMTVQNELASMSAEDRGRAAVAMLTTGMYLSPNAESSEGGLNATNALNSFLQSQINSIAGKALKTIDIGFGIDNTLNAQGGMQTDYNFSFAKHFWGNRISVVIGGKVSSGTNAQNTGMSIINNVSVEYRLDNSGTRYVRAFYNKDQETLLESEVMEMGAALVLRRKTERLGDLFIFRTKKSEERKRQQQEQATD